MSEPDSTPRRRPPTIDLTAKEVGTEGAGPAPEAAAAAAEPATPGSAAGRDRRDSRAGSYALGILIGAIAAGVAAAGFWAAGFVPGRDNYVPAVASAAKPAADDQISTRLDKIQKALQAPRPDDGLSGHVAAVEAQDKALGDSLAALNRRVDDVAAAVDDAKTAAKSAVQPGDLDPLTDRIAAVENAVKSLTADVAQRSANAGDAAARATVAAGALRAAAERGVSFKAELAAVKSFGADPEAVAALAPFAANGVPSAVVLGHELAALVPALQRAADSQMLTGTLLGRLEARAQRLVRITPVDAGAAPEANDTSSLIARINADAGRGDIDGALAELAKLPEQARAPAETWIKKAQAREAALAASRRIAADALGALGKPAAQ